MQISAKLDPEFLYALRLISAMSHKISTVAKADSLLRSANINAAILSAIHCSFPVPNPRRSAQRASSEKIVESPSMQAQIQLTASGCVGQTTKSRPANEAVISVPGKRGLSEASPL